MIRHDVVQGSYEWHNLRIGKVTGTRLKKVMSDSNLEVIDEMIAELETGYTDDIDLYVSEDMQRGTDLEPIAAEAYAEVMGVVPEVCGFITSESMPLLGMSPDRLIGDIGAIEIKCPKSKTHIKTIRQGKVPAEHLYQVICYFLVNPKLEWVDFISFDPRITKKPLFIHRVDRDSVQEKLNESDEKLRKFFEKFEKIKSEIFF